MSRLFNVACAPDRVNAAMWKRVDWKAAEAKLQTLQKELTLATLAGDHEQQLKLQTQLVEDLDIRCLAVRHVAKSGSGPGVDKVRWKTKADFFRAACELTSDEYQAKPLRQIDIKSRSTGKVRHVGIPTYKDKAMAYLHGLALAPILEAQADSGSFAFRKGRSPHDALALLRKNLSGSSAPRFIVVVDAEAFYYWVQHAWIMKHTPMDKHVLHELLKSGNVYCGRLFERGEEGITEGSSLSPLIANHMLDGLQSKLYVALHGSREDIDFVDGSLIRFADDIAVITRTYDHAKKALRCVEGFLRERGLIPSAKKSGIHTIEGGFTFLSEHFHLEGTRLIVEPSTATVDRFVLRLHDTISAWRYSQRELIERLNHMLTGWGNYHRFYDARQVFERVDAILLTMLLDDLRHRQPSQDVRSLKAAYFCRKPNGGYQHCLKDDPSVRVMSLSDVILVRHKRVRTSLNAYRDTEYLEKRRQEREGINVSGAYKRVWKAQKGRCFYCKRPILADEAKVLVTPDPTRAPSPDNAAYVHLDCLHDEHEIAMTYEPLTSYVPYDTFRVLEEMIVCGEKSLTHARDIPKDWKYLPLKRYFAEQKRAMFALSFQEIEDIIEDALPEGSRHKQFWYSRGDSQKTISRAWETEDYKLTKVRPDKKMAYFKRLRPNYCRLALPRELFEQRIPDDAAYELNRFFVHIIKKYHLVMENEPVYDERPAP